ncbi:NnrU family protein [Lutimaribacter sp. EGI FJ00015]|uniref:NnrU family protein n=1 Tax=Lutimaribacter degradans TaxID=2945989 RepID=A0ACC5ZZH0_9RHOB|nr:NnrU family protein [Lutimaribacter sp. EGI FJ00013]MCM2563442.1 NnrU family protein [Lutimaribacter sp. EGI FJ00013]MCO0614622.1 NnrU family protein [Lutimaribacter sp. EGI FJ00015]MCO0637293.1 NnrU family protein [Lutimaribacter sp. EGI FJ00014]
MTLLILGLVLWIAAHLFKRLAPGLRDSMGNAGKGLAAVVILAGLILMILGYRQAEFINVWYPPSWTTHLNNLLMLVAVFFFALSHSKGRLRARFRHPQLASVKIWAFAHLIVNGDLASIILFGGLLAWAVVEVILINRSEPWVAPQPGEAKRDVILVGITIVAFAVISAIHFWLGVSPFPG